jgi:hypothetical protein
MRIDIFGNVGQLLSTLECVTLENGKSHLHLVAWSVIIESLKVANADEFAWRYTVVDNVESTV